LGKEREAWGKREMACIPQEYREEVFIFFLTDPTYYLPVE
jgi:hypothetical protein